MPDCAVAMLVLVTAVPHAILVSAHALSHSQQPALSVHEACSRNNLQEAQIWQ